MPPTPRPDAATGPHDNRTPLVPAELPLTTEAVPDAARWHHRVLGARQYTIAGGTSEIQRNIIGERVLGLPRG